MPVVLCDPPYLMDLRRRTLNLREPGIRIINAKTGEHVASILPDDRGMYDAHAGTELARIIRQNEA